MDEESAAQGARTRSRARAALNTDREGLWERRLVAAVRTEHSDRIPEGWVYEPLVGDRDPPLDYRLSAGGTDR